MDDGHPASYYTHQKMQYTPLEAAIRWAEVVQREPEILELCTFDGLLGRKTFVEYPLLHRYQELIMEALHNGELQYKRQTPPLFPDQPPPNGRVFIQHETLKAWMEHYHPSCRPRFLFGESNADQVEAGPPTTGPASEANAQTADRLPSDNDLQPRRTDPRQDHPEHRQFTLEESQYWIELQRAAELVVAKYPKWSKEQGRIQKTKNLHYWIKELTGLQDREAEVLKKILPDFYRELR